MKERPILFSAPMVRAILSGTKTQTRRVVKPWEPRASAKQRPVPEDVAYLPDFTCYRSTCRYGQPGDRLWVREAWMPDPPIDDTWASTQWAGCREGKIAGVPERFRHPRFCNYAADWLHGEVIWTPSIHMPRWASRITLEVTGVRVERLQDISAADAQAEGIRHHHDLVDCRRQSFRALWESINGPGSWEANPWVWVVTFKRIEGKA